MSETKLSHFDASGSAVMVDVSEKPIAPTIQQAQEMDAAAKKYNRHLNIGFQLCYAEPMLELKRNFKRFGKLKGIDVLVSWPRNSAYFARPWAAKREMDGKVILDSIMMNACAHYFENPLFLLGDEPDKAAMPERIRGKLIRANNIEMFDTAIIEAEVNSVPFRYAVTHCGEENINPLTKFTFEDSTMVISHGISRARIPTTMWTPISRLPFRTTSHH